MEIHETGRKSPATQLRVQFRGVTIECVTGEIENQEGLISVLPQTLSSTAPTSGTVQEAGDDRQEDGPQLRRTPQKQPSHIEIPAPVKRAGELIEELLAECYRQALILAEVEGIKSIAFPAIGAGTGQLPFIEAADVACDVLIEMVPQLKNVEHIRLVFKSPLSAKLASTLLHERMRDLK